MRSIRIPDETYTDRSHEVIIIKKLEASSRKEDFCFVTTTSSTGFGLPLGMGALCVGSEYTLECRGFNHIAGLIEDGKYLFRHTDQHFEREHEEFVADIARERREGLEKNQYDYQRRENLLSSPWKNRLTRFHLDPTFKLEGWGYELVICELGQLMAAGDQEAVDAYAKREGVSGNQYDFAKALANRLGTTDFDRTPAGLSPLGATW